jgi:hypothetical protein
MIDHPMPVWFYRRAMFRDFLNRTRWQAKDLWATADVLIEGHLRSPVEHDWEAVRIIQAEAHRLDDRALAISRFINSGE